ncbi:helix-turn-helix domain-containing protein [Gulosibacter macacae]|uniref:Helix-turn-helix domain-containing protein n=1 Tax=Gulosibacter macacae TaxID=2488791 RepID=A0A3P3VUS7_9MICO|nr:helix-turn-helix domain-containing protein [Gulosibacter macacae]RRJ85728.1 helix-turn-helix domain-containing protein [Gulosibacter macacae]
MTMVLDTRAVAPAERAAYWTAGISKRLFPMQVDSRSAVSFDARLTGGELGPITISAISGGPHRVGRTARMIANADPERLLFYLVRRGECVLEQAGRGCVLRVGDLAAQETSKPSLFEVTTGFEMLMLAVPKWFLGDVARHVAERTATRAASTDSPLLRVSSPLLAGLERAADGSGFASAEAESAARMLLPLIGAIYGEPDGPSARGDELRERMRRFALANLHDPQLGPERLANEHFVSVRYVQKLFAADGGVSAWIRERRLEGAARDLLESRLTVASIAVRWGYSDAASFSRAFRRVHGVSPRELRAA